MRIWIFKILQVKWIRGKSDEPFTVGVNDERMNGDNADVYAEVPFVVPDQMWSRHVFLNNGASVVA